MIWSSEITFRLGLLIVAVVVFVVVAVAIYAVVVKQWDEKARARIAISRCGKCGELLGPQKYETYSTYPGANLHHRTICGNCGARFTYDQWGEFERETPPDIQNMEPRTGEGGQL